MKNWQRLSIIMGILAVGFVSDKSSLPIALADSEDWLRMVILQDHTYCLRRHSGDIVFSKVYLRMIPPVDILKLTQSKECRDLPMVSTRVHSRIPYIIVINYAIDNEKKKIMNVPFFTSYYLSLFGYALNIGDSFLTVSTPYKIPDLF